MITSSTNKLDRQQIACQNDWPQESRRQMQYSNVIDKRIDQSHSSLICVSITCLLDKQSKVQTGQTYLNIFSYYTFFVFILIIILPVLYINKQLIIKIITFIFHCLQ